MVSRSIRSFALIASLFTCILANANTDSVSVVENAVSEKFVLPVASDFRPGSYVLEDAAQNVLEAEIEKIKEMDMESIIVTGFSNTAADDRMAELAVERANSVRAFLALNGLDAARIQVQVGDQTESKERPGRVQLEIITVNHY